MADKPTNAQTHLSAAELDAALNAIIADSLRPVCIGLGALFLVLALAHSQLPPHIARVMMTVAALTAVTFLTLGWVLGRRPAPPQYAHPLAAFIAAIVLFNSLLHLALTADPLQTTNLILLLIGGGFLMLAWPWFAALVGVTWLGWIAIVAQTPDQAAWWHFGFALLSATALAVIIFIARLRYYRRAEQLRLQSEQQQARLQQQTLQLETLIGVAQSINAVLDLDVLLGRVVELIKEQYNYYYVGVFMPDQSGEYMVSRAGTGEAGRQLTADGFKLKVGQEGLIGWVALHRQPACVNDVLRDSRYKSTDVVPATRSELVLPLQVGETFVGILDIQSQTPDAFDESDVRMFQSLAGQVAIAIQNASTYQNERARRLLSDKLYDISRALSQTLDLQQVLDMVLDNLAQLVHFDRGAVMLRSGDRMEIVAARGFPATSNPFELRIYIRDSADDLFNQIYRTKQPLLIPEVLEWPGWQNPPDAPPARAWMGMPLIRDDEVIGVLSLTRETPTPYREDEVALAEAFAGQTAVALHNARLYDQLARTYEQLQRLDRTKSDFIAVVSHELRTPLTPLQGFSQMLRNDPQIKANPMHLQMVEGIHGSATRMLEIVNAMLDMAKIDSKTLQLHLVPLPVRPLLELVAESVKKALQERHLTLTIEEMPDLPTIEADKDALRKVFNHLVVNAIKYTPDGGHITLSAHAVPADKELPHGGVEVIVSDTGIGIDPQYQELIFAKFYQTGEVALHSSGTTKFKGGGPGLGLAIAKGIVEAHGGRMWVESPGYDETKCPGSKFHVLLPIKQT